MKYSDKNKPIICMQTNSRCYKRTKQMKVRGILWHSTGANNPNIKRYVQPSENDPNYKSLINLLGKNNNKNDWNHAQVSAGLNAWIGKTANSGVMSIQSMPWNFRPWGCANGSRGSCNDGWIQFEICEDNLKNPQYFAQIYQEACELTAYLCKKYNIDPFGYVSVNGIKVPTILCHKDSYNLKMGSGHADVLHWFPKYGKTMKDVRNDVAALMKQEVKEEDEDMTQEKFNEMMNNYLAELAAKPADWDAQAVQWAVQNGLIKGDEKGNTMPKKFLTRGEFATVMQRMMSK